MISSAVAVAAVFLLVPGWNAGNAVGARAARDVEIVAHDYAFAAPRALSAGEATFHFTNKGKVIHELDVALLKDGETARTVLSALNTKKPLKPLIETAVGILIARSGHRSTTGLSTHLLPGRSYLLICRLQDRASAPRHSQMGMFTVIQVAPSKGAAVRMISADTVIGFEYAFKTPRTLTPGPHTLAFVNRGKVPHEVNVALLRPGVSMDQAYALLKKDRDDDRVVEQWIGVLLANAGATAVGQLQVNLLPNRDYVISCGLANDDSAQTHLALGMVGLLRTSRVAR
jgi:hypothetical protein